RAGCTARTTTHPSTTNMARPTQRSCAVRRSPRRRIVCPGAIQTTGLLLSALIWALLRGIVVCHLDGIARGILAEGPPLPVERILVRVHLEENPGLAQARDRLVVVVGGGVHREVRPHRVRVGPELRLNLNVQL